MAGRAIPPGGIISTQDAQDTGMRIQAVVGNVGSGYLNHYAIGLTPNSFPLSNFFSLKVIFLEMYSSLPTPSPLLSHNNYKLANEVK